MSISHEEAQRLIQFKADDVLDLTNEAQLRAHLNGCEACRAYSNELKSTVAVLQKTMQKRWSTTTPPLQVDGLYGKVFFRMSLGGFLTTRMALAGIALLFFAFISWQSISSNYASRQYSPNMLPLIPTPSMNKTATTISMKNCQNIEYSVQEEDSLESIARRFSVSEESILIANNLTSPSLRLIQKLVIPICETTPTSTTNPPTFTITPIFEPVTTTPG